MRAYSRWTEFAVLFGLFNSSWAAYTLQDDYSGSNFFSMFDFFTDDDPTNGYVDFVSQSIAQSAGLINANNSQVYMGVDATNVASGRGRKSVRVTSKATYNSGLIVLDLEHMPGNVCGTWPAFWTVGPSWPSNGEIDIIEGVNSQANNAMTLHTGPGCSIASSTSPNTGSLNAAQSFSGKVVTSNCDVNAPGQGQNAGCSIDASSTSTFGNGLNEAQGGIYATEWTSDAISVWFFPRDNIPSDIDSSPDPSGWGTPLAAFHSTSCDIDSSFKNQQIVFDTTFCGDWAGRVWSTDATCSSKAATCEDYVQNNPKDFANAFWTINSLKVFTSGSNGTNPVSSGGRPVPSNAPTTTGRPPIFSGSATRFPTGQPTGNSSTAPCIPPLCSLANSGKPNPPMTTFTTSTNFVTQTVGGQGAPWRSHTWSLGGERSRSWGRHWSQDEGSSIPEATVAPVPIPLPQPAVRSEEVEADADLIRRHMVRHKRHGAA